MKKIIAVALLLTAVVIIASVLYFVSKNGTEEAEPPLSVVILQLKPNLYDNKQLTINGSLEVALPLEGGILYRLIDLGEQCTKMVKDPYARNQYCKIRLEFPEQEILRSGTEVTVLGVFHKRSTAKKENWIEVINLKRII